MWHKLPCLRTMASTNMSKWQSRSKADAPVGVGGNPNASKTTSVQIQSTDPCNCMLMQSQDPPPEITLPWQPHRRTRLRCIPLPPLQNAYLGISAFPAFPGSVCCFHRFRQNPCLCGMLVILNLCCTRKLAQAFRGVLGGD